MNNSSSSDQDDQFEYTVNESGDSNWLVLRSDKSTDKSYYRKNYKTIDEFIKDITEMYGTFLETIYRIDYTRAKIMNNDEIATVAIDFFGNTWIPSMLINGGVEFPDELKAQIFPNDRIIMLPETIPPKHIYIGIQLPDVTLCYDEHRLHEDYISGKYLSNSL